MSERIPSEREALTMLRISGCPPNVLRHSKAVARLAVEIAKKLEEKMNIDVDLVKIGALLHDIGRSKTHNVNHGIVGAEVAKSLGLSPKIIKIIERHIGGGITPEEAEKLTLPVKSYMPQTIEEKIVAYADKLIEGSKKVSIDRTIQSFKEKLGPNHSSIKRLERLHEEMSALLEDC